LTVNRTLSIGEFRVIDHTDPPFINISKKQK